MGQRGQISLRRLGWRRRVAEAHDRPEARDERGGGRRGVMGGEVGGRGSLLDEVPEQGLDKVADEGPGGERGS